MTNEISNNFFSILDLDPDATWDQEQFERRLREKQNQWSRESTGFTKKAQLAKKYLEQLSEIRRAMSDPTQREVQARAARVALSSRQSTREEEFTSRLQLIERKGFLEQSEVAGLIKEFQDVFDERTIRARISVAVRSPIVEREDEDEAPQRLEPIVLAGINEQLALVAKKDLYHLLALSTTAPHDELYHAAERLYNEMIHRQPKTADISALIVLAGHAKTLFKTEKMRRRYDISVRYQTLEALLKEIDAALKHVTAKKVYPQQVEDFVEKAVNLGWTPEIAHEELRRHAHQCGWQLQTTADIELSPKPEMSPPIEDIPQRQQETPPPVEDISQQLQETLPPIEERGLPQEVRELRFQNTTAGLRLTWLWPRNCNEVCLFYNAENWPQPERENRQFMTITRAEYEALGHYMLRNTTQQNYYIIVSLLLRHEGRRTVTPGTRLYVPLTHKMDITYEIKNPRFGYKQRTLHLYTQVPGILPTLLLVTKQGGLPFRKTEGTVLHREQGPIHLQREHIIQLPATSFPAQTFGKLFLEDDNLYIVVVLHQPHERKLRLG